MGFEYPASAYLMMGAVGISAVIAIIGGGAYILITVGSILFGKRVEGADHTASRPETLTPAAVTGETGHSSGIGIGGFVAPGTLALAALFLLTFVVYYFLNWKYLMSVWPMS